MHVQGKVDTRIMLPTVRIPLLSACAALEPPLQCRMVGEEPFFGGLSQDSLKILSDTTLFLRSTSRSVGPKLFG